MSIAMHCGALPLHPGFFPSAMTTHRPAAPAPEIPRARWALLTARFSAAVAGRFLLPPLARRGYDPLNRTAGVIAPHGRPARRGSPTPRGLGGDAGKVGETMSRPKLAASSSSNSNPDTLATLEREIWAMPLLATGLLAVGDPLAGESCMPLDDRVFTFCRVRRTTLQALEDLSVSLTPPAISVGDFARFEALVLTFVDSVELAIYAMAGLPVDVASLGPLPGCTLYKRAEEIHRWIRRLKTVRVSTAGESPPAADTLKPKPSRRHATVASQYAEGVRLADERGVVLPIGRSGEPTDEGVYKFLSDAGLYSLAELRSLESWIRAVQEYRRRTETRKYTRRNDRTSRNVVRPGDV